MNLKEFAQEVNKVVDEKGYYRFYLTEWGFDNKDECYFIDDKHHGFLNGKVTLKDNILEVYTIMHDGWDINKAIKEVADKNGITVKYVTSEELEERYLESIKNTPILNPLKSYMSAITKKLEGKTIKEVIGDSYDGESWIPYNMVVKFTDGSSWTIDFGESHNCLSLNEYLSRHIDLYEKRLDYLSKHAIEIGEKIKIVGLSKGVK